MSEQVCQIPNHGWIDPGAHFRPLMRKQERRALDVEVPFLQAPRALLWPARIIESDRIRQGSSHMTEKKLRVGVLFGGRSGEHEVSLLSAASVMQAMDRSKYEVVPIGITKQGIWLTDLHAEQLIRGEFVETRAGVPSQNAHAEKKSLRAGDP